MAVVGKKSTAIIYANDEPYDGKELLVKHIECELVSEITGRNQRCVVKKRRLDQYEITYQPTIKGRHQLHVKVKGQHIKGSPHH